MLCPSNLNEWPTGCEILVRGQIGWTDWIGFATVGSGESFSGVGSVNDCMSCFTPWEIHWLISTHWNKMRTYSMGLLHRKTCCFQKHGLKIPWRTDTLKCWAPWVDTQKESSWASLWSPVHNCFCADRFFFVPCLVRYFNCQTRRLMEKSKIFSSFYALCEMRSRGDLLKEVIENLDYSMWVNLSILPFLICQLTQCIFLGTICVLVMDIVDWSCPKHSHRPWSTFDCLRLIILKSWYLAAI